MCLKCRTEIQLIQTLTIVATGVIKKVTGAGLELKVCVKEERFGVGEDVRSLKFGLSRVVKTHTS